MTENPSIHRRGRMVLDETLQSMTVDELYNFAAQCDYEPADETACDACAAYLIAIDKEGAPMTDEFQDAHQTGRNANDDAFEQVVLINAERVQVTAERDALREEVARHRPWLFVPGDKVLVLLDETVYSGVVQQIQMPSPMGEQFPEYVVRVKLDEGSEFAGATPWCHPDQVERIHG